ncbi:sulfotransferase family protein [Planobispora rosea]|uniref:Sulfotransferase family protein n=1 Tax=Planobispora rosea TaxID=35762 RepID=A0A8J3WEH9_PLARO|nr:sulfotransferase [Planobispora rosea]GGS90547.1 sulfotransferase family protein [Planobispora rosea]GIH86989.1 sulfotransferase family protein [Planobispora rosea]
MTPVLVTGLPRSGTSWTGRMLAAGGELVYVNEPLNPLPRPGRSPGVLNADVTHRFQYISADDDEVWLRAFTDTVTLRYRFLAELRRNRAPYDLARMLRYGTAFTFGRLTGRRALLDDPFALLSAGWFAERLGCRVIVLIRDPVAFTGSWQRLGWTVYFHELLEQPSLVRDHPRVEELRPLVGSQDRLAKAAALWRVSTAVVTDLAARHSEILLVSYEELAADPLRGFRRLYEWADLAWSPRAESRISRACTAPTSPTRDFTWHGLSRTAFRPMDSRRALSEARSRLSPDEARRVLDLAYS